MIKIIVIFDDIRIRAIAGHLRRFRCVPNEHCMQQNQIFIHTVTITHSKAQQTSAMNFSTCHSLYR